MPCLIFGAGETGGQPKVGRHGNMPGKSLPKQALFKIFTARQRLTLKHMSQ